MDFFTVKENLTKKGLVEVVPEFKVRKCSDFMVRGKSFYAIWDQDKGLWSTDEFDVARIVDAALDEYAEKIKDKTVAAVSVKHMQDYTSRSWSNYKNFVRDAPDCNKQLDTKVTFLNSKVTKKDFVSKRLPYNLEEGPCDAYDELMSTLYDKGEREKIEWAVGSIIAGDSIDIQKFIVLYGDAGTGKSTVLNIIQKLFDGYYTVFDAKELTSHSNTFATEAFKANPLVAIQHDGDLSRIEDNTKINSIVSHEVMMLNEKYKSAYASRINCFLFMGTNKPVKITDAKSGIIRRLIDVRPTGNKVPARRYRELYKQIDFELGQIAWRCLHEYERMGKDYYIGYRPLEMMFKTDVFYNYVENYYDEFMKEDGTTLRAAWEKYKRYCDEALVDFKLPMYKFREELKNYFREYKDVVRVDGQYLRKYYSGFVTSRFKSEKQKKQDKYSLIFDSSSSLFDREYADCPAQYSTAAGTPRKKWENVRTTLKDISTDKLHYVKVPENHIVIDFDLKNPDGSKSLEKNLEAASKWPPTYAELSKSGAGIHLHYIYEGDVSKLSHIYSDDIEIKVFTGNSSLRRMLTRCNDIPIASINSGLPLKEEKPMINIESVKSERSLRNLIQRNLNKEIHGSTSQSINFIHDILEEAYNSGLKYDVSDMSQDVYRFAEHSTHQSERCKNVWQDMKFKSEEPSEPVPYADHSEILFYDVEVFSNLFVVCYKAKGKKTIKMINPSSADIEELIKFRLIGFNNRRYDNHILYARLLGYSNEMLFNISQRIIDGDKTAFFGEAYNLSYTDIYDFCSTKQSLKKWEIQLGIHHQELGLKWDQPAPEELWEKVADYCVNDVVATEAVWEANQADFVAREILADIAGMTVNDTTNQLTTKIIFGGNRKPQSQFMYRNLAEPVKELPDDVLAFLRDEVGLKIPFDDKSLLPYFPGYTFEFKKSSYKGRDPGEGGYVYSEPSMTGNVGLYDVASMHPSSVIDECLFGVEYTRKFKSLLDIRIAIKHKEYDKVSEMFDGKLSKYLGNKDQASALSKALKIAINSVYGLTSAKFENPFRDPRNEDNIVAKRGALFMIDLEEQIKLRGETVLHIKTDSIKVPDTDKHDEKFILDFGKKYGYNFEYEANYNKICLVNKAVYIARYSDDININGDNAGKWTATGAQFQHPYVFKKLFSKEPIEFNDMCETKNVSTALYLDMNEDLPDVSAYESELEKLQKQIKDKNSKLNKMGDVEGAKLRVEELKDLIKQGHNYVFVGRTGSFCPMKDGVGGGILVRENKDKFDSAPNSSGTRWMEAEMVATLGKESDINTSYFDSLCDAAIEDISKYGDFYWFQSDEKYVSPPRNPLEDWVNINSDELPF